jgi:predicted ATPase with chaperone activity
VISIEPTFNVPTAPRTLEETGLSADLVLQLVTKTLHFSGELSGTDVASRLGVNFAIIESSLDHLRQQRHVEIIGGGAVGAPSFRYRLTDAGRTRAGLFLSDNQYVGHLPVPLDQYVSYMRAYGHDAAAAVTREAVRRAFSHLVLSDRMLDQLGPAIAAGHSLFIYGPPGNGKTVISQAIRNVAVGDIAVPHAIAVDNHIVRVFDPVNHEPVEPAFEPMGLQRRLDVDLRWILCHRPLVTVGGELTLDGLDLGYNATAGFYRAPLQVLANGGVLVIDDFGRQHASPRDLLNRWIVPLESRIDYLTLQTGQKFEVPFEVFVVFATNLRPSDLVDEAFLRRIQYKVSAESPTEAEFIKIFENYCSTHDLAFDPYMVEALLETELRPRKIRLRGCQPRDLIEHALALASYLGRERNLTVDLLAASCGSYFLSDDSDVSA